MLKKRIIAALVLRDGIVVQSKGFNSYLPIGKPEIAVDFLNQWGIDEIILTDISATKYNKEPNYDLVKSIASKCQVPLTIGGGITKLDHIKKLMNNGADKISINQSAINNNQLVTDAAKVFGNQCVVVSIDSCFEYENYKVYDYLKKKVIDITPFNFAKNMESLGAGEILINSVEKDGSYSGYDKKLIELVCNSTTVPVIAIGGAKNAKDMIDVLENTNVSAAAAANFFHFTEHSVIISKSEISKHLPLRIDTQATYQTNAFDENYRLLKKDDAILEKMLYVKIEKEII
jgi:cyclase